MSVHRAKAIWHGNLPEGYGEMNLESNHYGEEYNYSSRFENGKGSSPEELIGAAHAGCFSMALSDLLLKEGYNPTRIETKAKVTLSKVGGGFEISSIHLITEGIVPDIHHNKFVEYVNEAKDNCPVSKALQNNVEITIEAGLL